MVAVGLLPGHVGGDRSEEAITQEEHEGRGPIDSAIFDEPVPGTEGVEAVVAGAGLAAKGQRRSVRRE